MDNNTIVVDKSMLNVRDTLECGQFFRYIDNGTHYTVHSLDKTAYLYDNGNSVVIENEDKEYFRNFFDLNTDYEPIKTALYDKPLMREAIDNAPALRILRQDPFETVIDFIISANNHIPRIKSIIERICIGGNFPTLDSLAELPYEFYQKLGAGYRDSYLYETVQKLRKEPDFLQNIKLLDTANAQRALTTLKGIGPKVADCILLFGYYRMDVFPVDTWIKKVYADIFPSGSSNPREMRKQLIETYGNYSGYAQQYLFYNKRGN